jgi:predicted aspartyl protease
MFGRRRGQNGAVRECLAVVDAGSDYCILPKVDAFALGYPDVARSDTIVRAPNTTTFVTHNGYDKAPLIKMAQVDIGKLAFKGVEFLAFDLPQVSGFDVVFGRSLLQFLRLEIDYVSGLLRIG